MIDTVILSIPNEKFIIIDHTRFNPSSDGLFNPPYISMGGKSFISCVQNPPKYLVDKYGYMPRLKVIKSIRKEGFDISMKIEFSIPKILYGNNFDEVDDYNFDEVLRLLHKKLMYLDVLVEIKDLRTAYVSSVHYSKNVILNAYTCSYAFEKLSKINLSSRIDIGAVKFKNSGLALHFNTRSRDIIFYDKVKDVRQYHLNDPEFSRIKHLQVFRYEIRLNNKKEIDRNLDLVDCDVSNRFEDLYSKTISKKILLHYWNTFMDKSYILFLEEMNLFDIVSGLRKVDPNIKHLKLLQTIGFVALIKEGGMKGLRNILQIEDRKWYRLIKEGKILEKVDSNSLSCLDFITKELNEFANLEVTFLK